MDVDRPNDMLVEIEVAEKLSREKIVSTYEEDMVGQKVLSRFVGDQMLRGMMELQLNGCTSFQFARSLLLDGMAELAQFKARSGRFRGTSYAVVEPTDLGLEWLSAQKEDLEEDPSFSTFRGAVLGYSCMDFGDGICSTRSFLETAMELPDPEILERVVHPQFRTHLFPQAHTIKGGVTENQRAKNAQWWSTDHLAPRLGRIIDLTDPSWYSDRAQT